MPLSYRNIIDGEELKNSLGNLNFKNKEIVKNRNKQAKYIQGYAKNTALEALANSLNINKGLFKQAFGLEDKQVDAYDPFHTTDAKGEEFWYSSIGPTQPGDPSIGPLLDGKDIQMFVDEDTNTFKRGLYKEFGFGDKDFNYEDPFIPGFELYFDTDSPLFYNNENTTNSLLYFIKRYESINPIGYSSRRDIWNEFNNVFFKIFESIAREENRNIKNKLYYIAKIEGINNLNKKIINYSGTDSDKITITLNEDISMIAWYMAELYNNLIYDYRNQRYSFPENILRFDMKIVINDLRNFTIPVKDANGDISTQISKKSKIVYTLHDCNFNFFGSKNYGESIEIGGFGVNNYTPQSLSFDIFFKSVTRWSEFPLQYPLKSTTGSINGWEKNLSNIRIENSNRTGNVEYKYFEDLGRKSEKAPEYKGYGNDLLRTAGQNVANLALNYVDNLEASLREVRGGVVNDILKQLNNATTINKIEPDNVYSKDFNNRVSLSNLGKQVASSLLNDLTEGARNAANF